ncbi:hypothetical protein ACFVX6_17500 [Streptomyces sp. NPDC058289]|uniref:hypothetical protein n=1 Tax=Streptomyces sp. NPDC058289 TaxID=3346425 RepID=UPI0036E7C06A
MSIKKVIGVCAAAAMAALILPAGTASAMPTSYVSDECSSSENRYCFSLHFNSRGGQTWYSSSPCFVSNKDIPNHFGYSSTGVSIVRYVFRPGNVNFQTCNMTNEGNGQAVKNNAASGVNGECSARYRVYFNSGYSGASQEFLPTCGDYWPAENLVAGLHNENASHDRY